MKIELLDGYVGDPPSYATVGSGGIDLCSPIDFTLCPGQIIDIWSRIKVVIPEGFVGLIVPRSGKGSKGLNLKNTIGVIDSDYRGEIRYTLVNTSSVWGNDISKPLTVGAGEAILQMLIVPVKQHPIWFGTINMEDSTARGEKGFGSTDRK